MDSQETRIYLVVALTIALICGILIYLVFLIVRQQQRAYKLQRKIALGEITALEKERNRIASDLHDDLGPLLAAIKIKIRLVEPLNPADNKEIMKSIEYLDDAIKKLRQISNDLIPTALERRGLVEAISELISNTMTLHALEISFTSPRLSFIAKDQEVHIYRMIQEGIFNCLRHASATMMKILITYNSDDLKVVLIDNGIGLPEKFDLQNSSGRGFSSFKNRTHILGGSFHVHSEHEKGTILEFVIPIK